MRWSETVDDYYDFEPTCRWGHGKPTHPQITQVLEERRDHFSLTIEDMRRYGDLLHSVPFHVDANNASLPFWHNSWFSCLDAASLIYFIASNKPKRYLEIGSGFSTMFARFAIQSQSIGTTLTSIDPKPRVEIDGLCDHVIRTALEDADLSVFDALERGDILFFDGSHRVFQNSDVTVFLLEVLPRLKPGVLIHVHDIFLPSDYVPDWSRRLYSEQYMIAAMLLCKGKPFEVMLANYFICADAQLSRQVLSLFQSRNGGQDIPMSYGNPAGIPGVSFWMERS